MSDDDQKVKNLEASGTLNRRPERIRSQRFRAGGFFDPRDLLQVRYEMVRSAGDEPLAEVAAEFGVSVPTCVRIRRSFREGGLQALAPVIEERFGVSLHPRTINKAIERSKKNTAPRYGRAR